MATRTSNKIPTKVLTVPLGYKLRLPHPYLTTYYAVEVDHTSGEKGWLRVVQDEREAAVQPSPIEFSNDLSFNTLVKPSADSMPPLNENSAWDRARRAPLSTVRWTSESAPSTAQIWLIAYFYFIMSPDIEVFRLSLQGADNQALAQALTVSMLCAPHPQPQVQTRSSAAWIDDGELIVSRSAFWQGAASPFGTRSPWTPSSRATLNVEPGDQIMTTAFPSSRVHAIHPRRPAKPTPGSVVYSRYIPTLDEHYSLLALDYRNEEHVKYFHMWQNDPRVSKAWNETGSMDEHRDYLRRQHEDPHQLTVLARFDDTIMSYFELYWAKEDTLGAYYSAEDFDRGRHTLMGDARYRGPHRVLAWWPCIIHYLFLDDCRTQWVVGEPKADNDTVIKYDFLHGLGIFKYVDFPHKRAVLVKVSREWFFQTCPLYARGGFYNGTGVPIAGSKL